jgi:hypothetical protein
MEKYSVSINAITLNEVKNALNRYYDEVEKGQRNPNIKIPEFHFEETFKDGISLAVKAKSYPKPHISVELYDKENWLTASIQTNKIEGFHHLDDFKSIVEIKKH